MIKVKSNDGIVDILEMRGTEKSIVNDVGAAAHKTLLLIANNSKTEEEVFIKYGILVRKLVDYLEETVKRIDEIGGR